MSERTRLAAMILAVFVIGPSGLLRADPLETEVRRDLRAPVPQVRRRAAQWAGERRLKGLAKELARLVTADTVGSVRGAAARALGMLRSASAWTALVKALRDKDANVRREAAWALGELHVPAALPALVRALQDSDYGVRDQAAYALSRMPGPDLIQRLEETWRRGEVDSDHALWLLKRLPANRSADLVNRLLADKQPEARLRGLQALLFLGEDNAAQALVHALADADPRVRQAAVRGLVKLHDYKLRPLLRRRRAVETDPAVQAALDAAVEELSREKMLVGYWPFENGAIDASGHGNDGEVHGCTPAAGKIGRALKFGPKRYIELGRPPALPIANRELTVMAWVQTDQPNGVVVARGGAFCGFSLYLKDHLPRFGIHRQEKGPAYIASGKTPVPSGWFHLAGVLRSDRLEVCVNGKVVGVAKTPGLIPGDCGQGMEIGADLGNSPAELTDPWIGVIDEVRVYHVALDPEEIAESMRQPQKPPPSLQSGGRPGGKNAGSSRGRR